MPHPVPASQVMRPKKRRKIYAKKYFYGAQLLNEPKEDVSLTYPGIIRGKQGQISYGQIAHQAETGTGFGVLVATASYVTNDFAFPFGANFAEVAVNLRTGQIRLNKFYALLDCGTPINPDLALGQIYGATLRAIGHSLTEEIQYDSQGIPLTRDLRSYGAPKSVIFRRTLALFWFPVTTRLGRLVPNLSRKLALMAPHRLSPLRSMMPVIFGYGIGHLRQRKY